MSGEADQAGSAVRFVLDESSVHAVYPPAAQAGNYTAVLPHVTLTSSVLPWERTLARSGASGRAPWLALLVFAEGELADDPQASGQSTMRTVESLVRPTEPGTLGPELSEPSEVVACRTIDVPAELFTALVPREEELHCLAHVRDASVAGLREGDESPAGGEYAVVTASRFPRAAGSYAVHLVSLEGFERILPADTRLVRLASLHSSSFTHLPDAPLDVAGLLGNAAVFGLSDSVAPSGPLLLAPDTAPVPGAQNSAGPDAEELLDSGYVPVPFRPVTGEATFAWYRGPFAPAIVSGLPPAAPRTTADHGLIYEPEYGLFDVSHAAAWTLGRTLALADPHYSADIVRARRGIAGRAADLKDLPTAPAAGEAPAPADSEKAHTQELLAATANQRSVSLAAWLDDLTLLRGVPFSYLVPQPDLLPPESLRLLHIDPAWTTALAEGARSTGVHTAADAELAPYLDQAITRASHAEAPAAGVLLNSPLVHDAPALDLTATRDGQPVTALRRTHPAPDILLVLFDAVPDQIDIREPSQGIHFGIDSANSHETINLRHLTTDRSTDTEPA
ncbi:hypothetical protein ACFH04_41805 [Streptomyces noboritoensis]|uniref:Uncharacterized protein n=1 Tax=Streptomyces noboritoensis TaxID=67337 RepID=A0ABV6TCV2_9ACTN